jgi:hypothetical protein
LLVTSRRLLLTESRLFRSPRLETIAYRDLLVARFRNMGLCSKVELLARQNDSYTLNLRQTHGLFGKMAVQKIRELAGLPGETDRAALAAEPRLASVSR